MKKLASHTIIGLAILSLSSCFLFQKHEDCPAYGSNEKVNQQVEKNIDVNAVILEEDKA